MNRCDHCGSRCRGRYCSVCGPIERQRGRASGLDAAQRARVSKHGPHRCDICERDFATKKRLREHDCALSDGGASEGGSDRNPDLDRRLHFISQLEELESEAIAAKEALKRENNDDAGVHLHQLQGRLESVVEDFDEWREEPGTDRSEHCDCVLEGDSPSSLDRCGETYHISDKVGELACTRPAGHDGPHSACTPAEHPAGVWDDE